MNKRTIISGLLSVIVLVSSTIMAEDLSAKWVGKDAPPFRLKNLAGTYERFYFTEPTVLDFFATWCAPCKAELPLLLKYYQVATKNKFKFAILNSEEDRSVLEKFASENVIQKSLFIPQAATIFKKFGVTALPTVFVIDSFGKVQLVLEGGDLNIADILDKELKRMNAQVQQNRVKP